MEIQFENFFDPSLTVFLPRISIAMIDQPLSLDAIRKYDHD
jgi:hypothetical protein